MYDIIQNDTSHFGVSFCIISYTKMRCIILYNIIHFIHDDTSQNVSYYTMIHLRMYDIIQNDTSENLDEMYDLIQNDSPKWDVSFCIISYISSSILNVWYYTKWYIPEYHFGGGGAFVAAKSQSIILYNILWDVSFYIISYISSTNAPPPNVGYYTKWYSEI